MNVPTLPPALYTSGGLHNEMGADLRFLLYDRPPPEPRGTFVRSVFETLTTLGLEYGGSYDDPGAPDGTFFSRFEDRTGWEEDFRRALAGAQTEGKGSIMYATTLANGEPYLLPADVGWERIKDEEFWRVGMICGLNQLGHDENLSRFLDALVLPLCAKLRPSFGWGDVWDWYEDPSQLEIHTGAPRRLAWFSVLSRGAVERLGWDRLRAVAVERLIRLTDAGVVIVSTERPTGFGDEVEIRERMSRDIGLPDLFADSLGGRVPDPR